jgi:hypothetical protein
MGFRIYRPAQARLKTDPADPMHMAGVFPRWGDWIFVQTGSLLP